MPVNRQGRVYGAISTWADTTTGRSIGSAATPIAVLACRPRSPNTSSRKSARGIQHGRRLPAAETALSAMLPATRALLAPSGLDRRWEGRLNPLLADLGSAVPSP
jgi:hypothetical protein